MPLVVDELEAEIVENLPLAILTDMPGDLEHEEVVES